jgi:hypothetical protein
MALNKLDSHKIFKDSQIHNGYQRRAMIHNHNAGLYQRQIELDISHLDARDKLAELEKHNKLLEKQLLENKALRNDLENGVKAMIKMIKDTGNNQRAMTIEEQKRLTDEIKSNAKRMVDQIRQSGNVVDKSFIDLINDLIKEHDLSNSLIAEMNQLIINELEKGNEIVKEIIDIKPEEIIHGMPVECDSKKPDGCLGIEWVQEPGKYRNIKTMEEDITIFHCWVDKGYGRHGYGEHYCASDKNPKAPKKTGNWDEINHYYIKQ